MHLMKRIYCLLLDFLPWTLIYQAIGSVEGFSSKALFRPLMTLSRLFQQQLVSLRNGIDTVDTLFYVNWMPYASLETLVHSYLQRPMQGYNLRSIP